MNKEQILLGMKIYSENGIDFILGEEEQRILLDYIEKLQQDTQKYKEVIDKAIKELNDYLNINTVIRDELLDILKEVE